MEHVVVERVLSTASQRLHEPLTLDDLASIARFSKYHFARMFRRVTGLSPRRFLYALRLQEAKRLLATTSRSVAEVSNDVGYHSVGTFTSRFAASVGVSPAVYRRCRGDVGALPEHDARTHEGPDEPTLAGAVGFDVDAALVAPVFVGLFRRPVVEGCPERWVTLPGPGQWRVRPVPDGRWYVLAVSDLADAGPGTSAWWTAPEQTMLGLAGPLTVRSGVGPTAVDVRLRPMRPVDPPVLTAIGRTVAPALADTPVAFTRAQLHQPVHVDD